LQGVEPATFFSAPSLLRVVQPASLNFFQTHCGLYNSQCVLQIFLLVDCTTRNSEGAARRGRRNGESGGRRIR